MNWRPDTSAKSTSVQVMETVTVRVIAGKSLEEWREFARRDDCLDHMVPSDLRQLIAAIR